MDSFVSRIRRSLASKVAQNLMRSNEKGRKTREKIKPMQPSGRITKERFPTYEMNDDELLWSFFSHTSVTLVEIKGLLPNRPITYRTGDLQAPK